MLRHAALVRTDISEESIASTIVFLHSMLQLLVTANVPSSPIPVTLMTETLCSSETSVPIRATWHNIPENVRFEVFMALTMKNSIFRDVTHGVTSQKMAFFTIIPVATDFQ
jgi:hypothetical protein